jgi:hypothetical protein
MLKTTESKKPFIGYVNDKRSCSIDSEDSVSVLWMYRKENIEKGEIRRLEKITQLLSGNKELFFSHYQDQAPVQSVFDKLKVRDEYADDDCGSHVNRVLAKDEMLCRFLYNHKEHTVSFRRRESFPSSSPQSSRSRKRSRGTLPASPPSPACAVETKRKRREVVNLVSSQVPAGALSHIDYRFMK